MPASPTRPVWRDSLKRPTFWIVLVLLAGFVYLQWPTRWSEPETPDYRSVTLDNGVRMQWEGEPQRRAGDAGPVWHLERKGVEFLVQQGPKSAPLTKLAERMLNADRDQVNGAVETPLAVTEGRARYALVDVENRIQRHRIFDLGDRWLKVSVLYKAHNEERDARARFFLNSVVLP